jgi:hypothetical protein
VRIVAGTTALLLAGCDLFFPLPEYELVPPETPVVTGRMTLRTIEMSGGMPEVVDIPGVTVDISVRFPNGEDVNIAVQDNGTFEFERPTNEYAFEYTVDGDVRDQIDNVGDLDIGLRTAGRTDAMPVTQKTTLTFPMAPNVRIATIGQWTNTLLDSVTGVLDWGAAVRVGGRAPGLFSSAGGDRMYYLRFDGNTFDTGQTAISGVREIPAFEMANGSAEIVNVTLDPTSETGCVQVVPTVDSAVTRLEAALSPNAGFGATTRAATIFAVPAPRATGSAGAHILATRALTSLDEPLFLRYHDPFPAHARLIHIAATATRQVIAQGAATPTNLSSSTTAIVEAPEPGGCPPAEVNGVIPFATAIRIADRELTSDGMVIDRSGPEMRVTWMPEFDGFEVFDGALLELRADSSGGTQIAPIRRMRNREPSFSIPAAVFEPNKNYVLQIIAVIGFPNATSGDYTTLAFPGGNSVTLTPVFQVQ